MALPSNIADALTGSTAVAARPNAPFMLVHHEARRGSWEVADMDGKPVWLPVLLESRMVPGANGFATVDRGGRPEKMWEGAVVNFERGGSVVLKPNVEYCGVKYLTAQPATDPRNGATGQHWHLWCETVKVPRHAEGKVRVIRDAATYNAWRVRLVLDGVIAQPEPDVTDWVRESAQRDLDAALALRVPAEIRDPAVAAAKAALARIEAAKLPAADKPKRGAA